MAVLNTGPHGTCCTTAYYLRWVVDLCRRPVPDDLADSWHAAPCARLHGRWVVRRDLFHLDRPWTVWRHYQPAITFAPWGTFASSTDAHARVRSLVAKYTEEPE